jgi:1,4-alpha-glucan branching enzyme
MKVTRLNLRPALQKFKRKHKKVRFAITAPQAHNVFLAGDFNLWDKENLPLKKKRNGDWDTSVKLSSGKYEYKFVVDGEWKTDPRNENQIHNDWGTVNSVLTVTT